MKTAIVVGANGFLGSALVNKLINNKMNVVAVYNNNKDRINKHANIVTAIELFKSKIVADYLFFAVGNYTNSHSVLLEINNELVSYTKKFPNAKLVYISSTNVYGVHEDAISEGSSFNNPSLYAISKIAGEFIASSLKNYAILRLTYLYGPGITNNSFIPTIIKSASQHKIIQLAGDGSRYQDYLFIDDAVEFCIRAALHKENSLYLAASGVTTTNIEVALEIQKYINCQVEFEGENKASSFKFNPSKTFEILNWKPSITIVDGIKQMFK